MFETLTKLQYSDELRGLRLHIYEANNSKWHGSFWFQKRPRYPDEEITTEAARQMTAVAIGQGREVRITNGGDLLVFHWKDGQVQYPAGTTEIEFWLRVQKAEE